MSEPSLPKRVPFPDFFSRPHQPRRWYIPDEKVTAGDLCKTCRHINFKYLLFESPFSEAREEIQLGRIADLSPTCTFCHLAKRAVEAHYGEVDETARLSFIAIFQDPYSAQTQPWHLKLWLKPQPSDAKGSMTPTIHCVDTRGWIDARGSGYGINVGGTVNIMQAALWVWGCRGGAGCCKIDKDAAEPSETHLPPGFRLIDVKASRIVEIHDAANVEYYALSYVWGKCQGLRLLKENVEQLSRAGALEKTETKEKIPLSIQDAMLLAARLNATYLWVDALCIVQDDLENKATQIAGMRSIYSKALATLVAAHGSDANAGVSGVRPGTRKHCSISEHVQGLQLAARPRDFEAVAESRWNSRMWTYQERLLSQRALFFTGEQMLFKCNHTDHVLSEDCAAKPRARINAVNPSNDGGRDIVLQEHSINLVSYEQVVRDFSKRDVTNPGDVLDAFVGVGDHLSRVFHSRLIYGLVETEIVSCLLWRPSGPSFRRTSAEGIPLFPSWSWAGWVGQVDHDWNCRDPFPRIIFHDSDDRLQTEDDLRRPVNTKSLSDSRPWWADTWEENLDDKQRTYYHPKTAPNKWFAHPVAEITSPTTIIHVSVDGVPLLKFWAQTVDLNTGGFIPPVETDGSPHWLLDLTHKEGPSWVGGRISLPSQYLSSLNKMKLSLIRIARTRSHDIDETRSSLDDIRAEHDKASLYTPPTDSPLSGMEDLVDLSPHPYFPVQPAYDTKQYAMDWQRFDMKKPYCVNQLLLVEWVSDGTARRIGHATVHVDFWAREKPVDRLILLG